MESVVGDGVELTAESSTLNFSQQGKPRLFEKMDRMTAAVDGLPAARPVAKTGGISES